MKILEILEKKDGEIKNILEKYNIGLEISEIKKVCEILGRNPTLVEAIIYGIQGSEHASYKSTRNHLKKLPIKGPNVILGPGEDSGIIKLCDLPNGDEYGIILSHESHNSPSQIVPYEGAATGVGGIMRDIICMGGKAIGVLDSLRFGDLSNEKSKIIAKNCIKGIAGYGNPIGVPNLGGDIYFDENFKDYCLVNVFATGLIKKSQIIHSFAPDEAGEVGYDFIIIGKATDRSGFGGSSFSSKEIDESKEDENKGAVQEPNPFLERHIMASTYDLFEILEKDGDLDKVGFKDMGAGGILCATVELVADKGFGAEIDIEKIHTLDKNLPPEVIACGETQERFAWLCHPSLTQKILKHYNEKWDFPGVSFGAKASHIGNATKDPFYKLKYKGEIVCNSKSKDITEGLLYDRKYIFKEKKFEEPAISKINLEKEYLKLISSTNIASKTSVFENYDRTVQGKTVLERCESKASVISPLLMEKNIPENLKNIGIGYSQTGNFRYGLISAYTQATNAVAHSMLLVSATGNVPQTITDCLNYGNPEKQEEMGDFVKGIEGIKYACENIKLKGENCPTPINSGNVSMYKKCPPSAIIGCMGKIENVKNAIGNKFKKDNSSIILVGKRKNELGGSEFYRIFENCKDFCPVNFIKNIFGKKGTKDNFGKILGKNIPKTDFQEVEKIIYKITDLISKGKILSSNIISIGGIAGALTEMIMPNQKENFMEIGAQISLKNEKLEKYQEFFSETLGVLIEVSKENEEKVLESFGKDLAFKIGETNSKKSLEVCGEFEVGNEKIFEKFGKTLREKMN